jgi:hypothetical protein
VDNRSEDGDKFANGARTHRTAGSELHRLAQVDDSTRSVRSSRALTRSRRLESVPIEGRISEEMLLEGYGLDPDDLEAELLDRGRWRAR